ncbi:MAG TPA: M56 family metallopeptidase [Chitinophagaceae bacterium]|nr:M56 family metallopeptidase [Chitinophagaceae bacterium]
MNLPYIINAALVLAACVVFYKLLLRRETFYRVNRYMLLLCLAVSFALPLLQVPQEFSLRKKSVVSRESEAGSQKSGVVSGEKVRSETSDVNRESGAGSKESIVVSSDQTLTSNEQPATFSFGKLLGWAIVIYWFGVIVFAASFLFQVGLLIWRAFRNPVIVDGKYRIVEVSGDKAPCSFGNIIFINPEKYEWDVYNQILSHEKIHIRQKHTLDILFAELVLIFQWFNPFAWTYRREIESNLEFLTDDQLVHKNEIDKKSYQLSLVKVSAPHLPLSLTTNYNQSILKKRIAMMNRKKSNLHTAWKYFFMLPLLALLACLLNEPVANSQESPKDGKSEKSEKNVRNHGMETEGYWFAIIKDDKVNIRFSDEQINDDDEDFKSGHSYNATTFKLSELGNIPKGTAGTFSISREAGKMEMTGKFEGNTGMGRYKFIADKAYTDYMNKELKENLDDEEQMSFFFINIRKDYLQMLKSEGFTNIGKDDIIPMAAMKIDAAYIKSIRDAGFKDVGMQKLIPLKALGVDGPYIKEIREAGYKNVTADQLVTFKAQGIDKAYITKVRQSKGNNAKEEDDDADEIVSFKAMGIDDAYINSFKAVGLNNIPNDQLVSFKAVGVTPEYIKSWHALGFKDINPEEFVGMKSQNVTPEYMKSFTDMGYKNIEPENLVAFRALGITPEFVKSFEAIGYKDIDLDELPGLKAQNITPEFIKSFEAVGFKNIKIEEIVSVKAVGVTPEYIKEMKSKGFDYNRLEKYVRLKTID